MLCVFHNTIGVNYRSRRSLIPHPLMLPLCPWWVGIHRRGDGCMSSKHFGHLQLKFKVWFSELQLFFQTSFFQVVRSPQFHRFTLDHPAHCQPFPLPAEVNVGRRQAIKWLMVPMIVVILNKPFDFPLQLTRQVVVLEVDYVLDGPMVPLDLPLLLKLSLK